MKDNTDRTLVLIGLVCLFLLLLHFLPTMTVGGVELRQVSVLSDLSPHQPKATTAIKPAPKAEADSTGFREQWPKGTQPIIDYGKGKGQTNGMDHFYAALDSLQRHHLTARPLRIAYFTDSYCEGDILTADLRELLQKQYGGQGAGWIDAANTVNKYRISLTTGDQGFTEHLAVKLSKDDETEYVAAKAGLDGRYATYGPGANLHYNGGSTRYPHASTWQVARVYLRPDKHSSVTARLDASASQGIDGGAVREATFTAAAPVSRTTVSLGGAGTAFGTSLEGRTGIVLDNFAMRSASGQHLADVPEQTLRQFQALRHYDLIIIAYGGNVVLPTNKPDDSKPYLNSMVKVIDLFKRAFAGTSILVFGSPDNGHKTPEGVVTTETIKALIAGQQELAANAHVGFYNLQQAMGGDGTAGRMHEQKLVNADFFHINQDGGAYAAQRIFRSINAGLKNYQRRMGKKPATAPKQQVR